MFGKIRKSENSSLSWKNDLRMKTLNLAIIFAAVSMFLGIFVPDAFAQTEELKKTISSSPPSYSTRTALDFLYILINGISEVPLLSSPVNGILILAGVFLASRKAGIMMIIAGLIGAGTAFVLGADYDLVTFGLFGYNSILTGMAFWSGPFTKSNGATFVLSILGAMFTAVVWCAFAHVMGDWFVMGGPAAGWAIPAFTGPFIFTTWVMMFASKRYGHAIWPAGALAERGDIYLEFASGVTPHSHTLLPDSINPAQEIPENFRWTAGEFMKAVLKGISQVTFVADWRTGIFWVVGLSLTFELAPGTYITPEGVEVSRIFTNAYTTQWNPASMLFLGGVVALIGSAIGLSLGILQKLPVEELKEGIHGFNQVLVMIALTSFLPYTMINFFYAVLATVACSIITPAMQNFFGRWGVPALTGPFVFTAWVFLWAVTGFDHIPAGLGWGKP